MNARQRRRAARLAPRGYKAVPQSGCSNGGIGPFCAFYRDRKGCETAQTYNCGRAVIFVKK